MQGAPRPDTVAGGDQNVGDENRSDMTGRIVVDGGIVNGVGFAAGRNGDGGLGIWHRCDGDQPAPRDRVALTAFRIGSQREAEIQRDSIADELSGVAIDSRHRSSFEASSFGADT
jgi:hypothetical protein